MFVELNDFPNCHITKNGLVKGVSGIILKPIYDKDGYTKVSLRHKNGKLYSKRIHILVAVTFIPNPLNKPMVNHINGIKDDNRIDNLEWVTASENGTHAFRELCIEHPNNKAIEIYHGNKLLGVFKNNSDAQKSLKVNRATFIKYRNCGKMLYGCLDIVEVKNIDESSPCYNVEIISESDSSVLNSKPLQCNNGKVYKSIENAAEDLGINHKTVAKYMGFGIPYKNLEFIRITPYEYLQQKQQSV